MPADVILDGKTSRKKKEEEEDSFSQDSRATTAQGSKTSRRRGFFDAPGTINEGDEKSEGNDA